MTRPNDAQSPVEPPVSCMIRTDPGQTWLSVSRTRSATSSPVPLSSPRVHLGVSAAIAEMMRREHLGQIELANLQQRHLGAVAILNLHGEFVRRRGSRQRLTKARY